jgi:hypothetical protein
VNKRPIMYLDLFEYGHLSANGDIFDLPQPPFLKQYVENYSL